MRKYLAILVVSLLGVSHAISQSENVSQIKESLKKYEELLLAHDEANKVKVIEKLQSLISDDLPADILIPSYIRIGETTGEMEYLQKAITLIHQNPTYSDSREIALAYHMIGRKQLELGAIDVALTYQDSSNQIIMGNKDIPRIDLSRNYEYMAYSTYGQGLYQKTMSLTKEAINTLEVAGVTNRSDSVQVARLANNLAYLNGQFGRSSEVVPLYKKALAYDEGYVDYHTFLATEYMNSSKFNLAIKECNLGLKKLETSPSPLADANLNHTLLTTHANAPSSMFSKGEKKKKIIYYYGEVENLYSQYPDHLKNIYGAATGIMSDYALVTKDVDQARIYAEKQADLFQLWDADFKTLDPGYRSVYAVAFGRLGDVAALDNDYEKAENYYKKAIHAYYPPEKAGENLELMNTSMLGNVQNSWNGILVDNLFNLESMHLYQALQTDPAEVALLQSANHKIGLIDSLVVNNLNENLFHDNRFIGDSYLFGAQATYHLYKKTGEEKYLNLSFERLAKIQSLRLYNHWEDSKIKYKNSHDENILGGIKTIKEEINHVETLLNKGDSIKNPIYQARLDSMNQLFQSLVEKNETIMADAFGKIPYHFPDGLSNYRMQLKDNELGIFFGSSPRVTDPTIEMVLLSKDDFLWLSAPKNELDSLVEENLVNLSDPASTDYPSVLKELYALLIMPIEKHIQSMDLVLHLDERMKMIPFELLMDKDNRYLFEQNNVRYENLQFDLKSSKSGHASKGKMIAFSASPKPDKYIEALYASNDFSREISRDDHLSYLSAANEEVQFLEKTINAKIYQGESATKAQFIKRAPDAKILHLALHAIVDNDGMASKLVFSDAEKEEDSYMYYHEIDDLVLKAELVTLSACNTGNGNLANGNQRSTLALAFAYAGCTNIVQSLWAVNDNSTKELMKHFYQNMKGGMTKPMALNEAKKQFLAEAPVKWKHPYYWAGFVYSGDNASIEFTGESFFSSWKFYGLLAIMGIGALYFFGFRGRTAVNT